MNVLKALIRFITVTGKYGLFFRMNNEIYHLRWAIEYLICDYAMLTKLAGHGYPNSNCPCVLCSIRRVYLNTMLGIEIPLHLGQVMENSNLKIIESSLQFVNPSSLVRYFPLNRNQKYWKTCAIPRKYKEAFIFNLLNHIHLHLIDKKTLNGLSIDFSISLEDMLLNLSSQVFSNIDKDNPENNNKYQLIVYSPFVIDIMHLLSNFILRIAKYLNHSMDVKDLECDAEFFQFAQTLDNYAQSKGGHAIPDSVKLFAWYRLSQLNVVKGCSWIDQSLILPDNLSKLTCERRFIYYFCLFGYIYQDSQDNPIIKTITTIIDIIGEMYNIASDYDRASLDQAHLSYFMGKLELQVPPYFRSSTTHIINHIYKIIFDGGRLTNCNCYGFEHDYKEVKNNTTRGHALLKTTQQREEGKTVMTILSYSMFKRRYEVVVVKPESNEHYSAESAHFEYCIIDDYILFRDSMRRHKSYLDYVMTGSEPQQWMEECQKYSKHINISNISTVYKSISFNNKNYESYYITNTLDDMTNKKLCSLHSCIGFVRGYDHCLYYYLVRGYCVCNIGDYQYPVAVCNPIKTESMSELCYTYYHVKVLQQDLTLLHNHTVYISLRRITIGTVLPIWVNNGKTLNFCPMKANLVQFNDIADDSFFFDLFHYFDEKL